MRRVLPISILFVISLGVSSNTFANEFTEVIDSFDNASNDPFDINISVGYLLESKKGTITRETTLEEPHKWDHYAYRNMFEFKHVRHILDLNLEVGIFRDVSLRLGLPLILSDMRTLSAHSDWNNEWRAMANQSNNPLFGDFARGDDTFESPKRSGIDIFTVGLWVNPLDQSRDDTYPNWTLFLEGRFGVGSAMKASCAAGEFVPANQTGGRQECSLVDRGGVGRGVNSIRMGTRMSRRIGMLDPYFGFDAQVGFAKDGTDFFITDREGGQINTMPPVEGRLDFGTEIVPWEQPEKHRRVAIGIGAGAEYHSEGRDYTPLYDALGTSGYFRGTHAVDFGGQTITVRSWSGMTDIENYATIFGQVFVVVEPAKYVKFRMGGWFAHETEHFITKTDMCSIDLMGMAEDAISGVAPEVCSEFNMGYRPELDDPGTRFRAESTFFGKFFLDLTAMF